MFQALYLSLYQYRATAPDDQSFIGLDNYVTVLTDQLWWKDVWNTVVIMVVTVGVELVIGFAFAVRDVEDHLRARASSGRRS